MGTSSQCQKRREAALPAWRQRPGRAGALPRPPRPARGDGAEPASGWRQRLPV